MSNKKFYLKIGRDNELVILKDIKKDKIYCTVISNQDKTRPLRIITFPYLGYNARNRQVEISLELEIYTIEHKMPNFGNAFYNGEAVGYFYCGIRTVEQIERAIKNLEEIKKIGVII